jgi:hypothetical protein
LHERKAQTATEAAGREAGAKTLAAGGRRPVGVLSVSPDRIERDLDDGACSDAELDAQLVSLLAAAERLGQELRAFLAMLRTREPSDGQ